MSNLIVPPQYDLSACNASIRIVVPMMYPNGITADTFDEGNILEVSAVDTKQLVMTADGKLLAGQIYNNIETTIHLQPVSDLATKLRLMAQREAELGAVFAMNMTVQLSSLGQKMDFVQGYLNNIQYMPSLSKVIEPMAIKISFQACTTDNI